jgi:hypothetical protein
MSILLSVARFVLSMNCEHHIRQLMLDHNLICTTYSPKAGGEQAVDKMESPMKPTFPAILIGKLFTAFGKENTSGEQVSNWEILKTFSKPSRQNFFQGQD